MTVMVELGFLPASSLPRRVAVTAGNAEVVGDEPDDNDDALPPGYPSAARRAVSGARRANAVARSSVNQTCSISPLRR